LDLDDNQIGDKAALGIINKELGKNLEIVTEVKAFLVYKYCCISLLPYDKPEKQKEEDQGGEKKEDESQDQRRNEYQNHQDLDNCNRDMQMSSSFSSSSLLSLSSSSPPTSSSKRKEQKQVCLSPDIVRLISEFLEWEDLHLTRENYKESPLSILALFTDLGQCSNEFSEFFGDDFSEIFSGGNYNERMKIFGDKLIEKIESDGEAESSDSSND
jgi:hypothetical protein